MVLWKSHTPIPVPQFISSLGQRYVINCNAFCIAITDAILGSLGRGGDVDFYLERFVMPMENLN